MPAQLPEVVARVNGESISRDEFEQAVRDFESRSGPVMPDTRDQVYRGVLDDMMAFRLRSGERKTRKIEVPPAKLDDAMRELRGRYNRERYEKTGTWCVLAGMDDYFSLVNTRRAELPESTAILIGEPEPLSYDTLQRTFASLIHGEHDWDTVEIPKAIAKAPTSVSLRYALGSGAQNTRVAKSSQIPTAQIPQRASSRPFSRPGRAAGSQVKSRPSARSAGPLTARVNSGRASAWHNRSAAASRSSRAVPGSASRETMILRANGACCNRSKSAATSERPSGSIAAMFSSSRIPWKRRMLAAMSTATPAKSIRRRGTKKRYSREKIVREGITGQNASFGNGPLTRVLKKRRRVKSPSFSCTSTA